MTSENKPRRLDRRKFAEFVRQITGAETVRTNGEVFTAPGKRGKTLLYLRFQPQTECYWYTISLTSQLTSREERTDRYHELIATYLRSLELNRNMILVTDTITSQI